MITNRINKLFRMALIAVIVLLAIGISPGSAEKLSLQPLPAPMVDPTDMGSGFSYQGRLMNGTNPANGIYDFKFSLYDDYTAGTLVATDTKDNITVTDGLFMLKINLHPESGYTRDIFNGFERWLEIEVKADTDISYTTLSSRQPIFPTPYASFAGTIYRKTIVVKPVTPSGTNRDNGQLLLDAIASVSSASWSDRYLIKLEPGIYHVGENHLELVPYVDLEGSGEGVTVIAASGSEYEDTGTVIAASDTEIRSLTILSLGVGPDGQKNYATAVYVPQDVTTKMNDVSIEAFNGLISTRGIFTDGAPDGSGGYIGANAYLNEISIISQYQSGISGEEQPEVVGIYSDDGSYVFTNNSKIDIANGYSNYGIYTVNSSISLEHTNVVTKAEEPDPETQNSYGIFADGSYVTANDSTVKSINGNNNYGLYLLNTAAVLETTEVNIDSGFDGTDSTCAGIYANGASSTLNMRNSTTNVYCYPTSSYHIKVTGIEGEDSGLIQLFDSTITVRDGMKGRVTGISMLGNSLLLELTNVTVDVFGENEYNYGIVSGVTPFVIRDSFIYARDGEQAIGLAVQESEVEATPEGEVINTVIKAEATNTHSNPDPGANDSIGIRFVSDGKLTLTRNTIWVKLERMDTEENFGGVGVYVEEGTLVMENSKINNEMYHAAYMGVALKYTSFLGNVAYINNSEIYSCLEDYCHPVAVNHDDPAEIFGTIAHITSTLLAGGPVNRPPNAIRCMWVTDESYDGYGWPDLDGAGPLAFSYICP